jgi:hypothetical protein
VMASVIDFLITVSLSQRSGSGDRARFTLAAVATGHCFLQGIEPGALAEDLGQRITLERSGQDVAAERHFGVVGLADQLPQAGEVWTQEIEVVEIALGFGEIEFRRDDLLVLPQNDQRLPAKRFRLVAHLGQAAPLVDRKFDQAAEFLLQGSDRGGNRRQVVGADIQRYEVLAHEYFLLDKTRKSNGAPAVSRAPIRAVNRLWSADPRRCPAGVLYSAPKPRVVPRQRAARAFGQRLTTSPGTPPAEQTATGKGGSSLRGIVRDKRRTSADSATSQEPSPPLLLAIAR